MQIIINDKTYVINTVKSRMLRKAIQISEKIDFNNMKVSDLDELVNFVCECYENKFAIDDVYDSVPSNKLISTISDVVSFVNGSVSESLEKFPK